MTKYRIHILIATHKPICVRDHFESKVSTSYIPHVLQLLKEL